MRKIKIAFVSLGIIFSCFSIVPKSRKYSSFKKNFTITIDPGHGGVFNGCQHNGIKEKDLTLDIAQILKNKLAKHANINVILTRKGDYNLEKDNIKDLAKRTQLANDNNSNLLVSIHINSKPQTQIRGYELYVPHNGKFPMESYLAACIIHHKLSNFAESNWVGNYKNINGFDRGIRAAKFNIFKKLNCPGVLVELDYLTNPVVNQKFKTDKYKEELADILYRAIIKYAKGKKYF